MNTKCFCQQSKDCSLYNANEKLLQNAIVREPLAYLWGLSKSMLCYMGFPILQTIFFFLRYVSMRFTQFKIWVKTGVHRSFLKPINSSIGLWQDKQTNKQTKKDTIWTPFEFQMLHCLGLMEHSLNLIWFLLRLRSIFKILSSNLSTEDNFNKLG